MQNTGYTEIRRYPRRSPYTIYNSNHLHPYLARSPSLSARGERKGQPKKVENEKFSSHFTKSEFAPAFLNSNNRDTPRRERQTPDVTSHTTPSLRFFRIDAPTARSTSCVLGAKRKRETRGQFQGHLLTY